MTRPIFPQFLPFLTTHPRCHVIKLFQTCHSVIFSYLKQSVSFGFSILLFFLLPFELLDNQFERLVIGSILEVEALGAGCLISVPDERVRLAQLGWSC